MISVVSRDARKRLLLLDCSVEEEEEMDETEVEEGEALSSHEDDEPSIDPDALSYIDEKLQNVLGHFQKDFEDGIVSVENLGAKFGIYGSFLPAHQRASQHIESSQMRVRIKVGSEMVNKKSELYRGLGIEVGSSDSEGCSRKPDDGPFVSPTSILQIMTSFPLIDDMVLLSPLTDHLICLTEKEKFRIEADIDIMDCDELVANTLKLPLLSSSDSKSVECVKGNVKEEEKLVTFSKACEHAQTEGVVSSSNWKASSNTVKEEICSIGKKRPKSKHSVEDVKVTKYGSHLNGQRSKTKIGESRLHNCHQEDNDDVGLIRTPELVGKNTLNGLTSKGSSGNDYEPNGDVLVPPLVKEYWVGCDKCQKWRLLPLGIYPKSLPEKWLCSMLDWLPGMNRCSVSEEETTKAVTTLNLLQPANGEAILPGRADQSHENRGNPSMPCVGKKKPVVKEMSNSKDLSGTEQSLKKNIKASTQSISLNELPPNNKSNHKEKNKQLGDMRTSKIQNKGSHGHSDQDEDLSSGAKVIKRNNNVHDSSKEHLKASKNERSNISNDAAKDARKRKLGEGRQVIEEMNENNHKIGKKTKVSMSGWKGASKSKTSVSITAASSSSKVSGSPVESVSSSPMRISNNDRAAKLTRRDHESKKDCRRSLDSHEKNEAPLQLNTHPPTKLPKIADDGKRNKYEGHLDNLHVGKSRKDNDGDLKDRISNVSKEAADNSFARSGKVMVVDKVAHEKAKSQTQTKSISSSQEQKQNQIFDDDGEKSSRKPNLLPPSGRSQNDGFKLVNGVSDSVKRAKNVKTLENDQSTKLKNLDVSAPSPLRKESFSQAATMAVKEAKDLKHMADRVKNSGESAESTSLYFQAALKFLHGASLMELSSTETSKQSEMIQSIQTYTSTAKLCNFCATEYEKSKDMAHAALAYKCMEVAYLRVVYTSHSSASRDRHELQTSLPKVPGESPSSSNSDIDNLNHPAIPDKSMLTNGVNSPQVAGHVITAKTRPSFQRLLNFAQDVNYAMEASRKLRAAFAAAKSKTDEIHHTESLASVKRALDFNFYDVEGLILLIRLAVDAMSSD